MDNYNYNHNNNWRNQKEENIRYYNQVVVGAGSRPRSHSSRRSSFGCQPSSWEKKFCATAGVPWRKVLETKKYMYQDEKVLKWNDSAVKEAFWNAKKRFWAKMHGQPCNINMPDPDIFIDKIDWDSNVDPNLILDLEKREPDTDCESEKPDGGVIVGIPVVPEQYLFTPNGWGDAEEKNTHPQNCEQHDGNGYDPWNDEVVNEGEKTSSREWEDGYTFMTTNRASDRENRVDESTWYDNRKQWDHGNRNLDHRDRSWNTSRYKVSQFHHNNVNDQSLVDEYKSKRGNFSYKPPLSKWRPVRR